MERSLAIRFTIRDADKARADLQKVGQGFEATSKDLSRAASDARREVNKLGREARRSGESLDAQTEASRAADKALTSVTRAEQRAARQAETLNTAVAELTRRHRAGEISADQMRNSVRALERLYGETAQSARVLGRDSDRLRGRLRGVSTTFDQIADRAGPLAPVLRGLGPAGTVAAVGIGAAAGALIGLNRAVENADQIAKTADAIGVSTDALQELRFAAERSGITTQRLDDGLSRLNRRLGLFVQDGGGPAAKAFEDLGLAGSIAAGQLQTTDEVLDAALRRLSEVEDSARRAAIASQLFGEEAGPRLALLVRDGIGGLEALRQQARDLGLVLDESLLRNAETLSDQFGTLTDVIGTQLTRAALQLGPVVSRMLDGLIEDMPVILANLEAFAQRLGVIDEISDRARVVRLRECIRGTEEEIARLREEMARGLPGLSTAAREREIARLREELGETRVEAAAIETELKLAGDAAVEAGSGFTAAGDAASGAVPRVQGLGDAADDAGDKLTGGAAKVHGLAAEIGNLQEQLAVLDGPGGLERLAATKAFQEAREIAAGLSEEELPRVRELLDEVGVEGETLADRIARLILREEELSETVKTKVRRLRQGAEATRDSADSARAAIGTFDELASAVAGTALRLERLREVAGEAVPTAGGIGVIGPTIRSAQEAAEDAGESVDGLGDTFDDTNRQIVDGSRDAADVFRDVWQTVIRSVSDQLADLALGLEGSFSPRRLASSVLSANIVQPALSGLTGGAANDNGPDPLNLASNVSSLVPSVGGNLVSAGTFASAVPSLFSTGAVEAGTGALAANILGTFASSLTNPVTLGLGAISAIVGLSGLFGGPKPGGLVGGNFLPKNGFVDVQSTGQKDVEQETADQIRQGIQDTVNAALLVTGARAQEGFGVIQNLLAREGTRIVAPTEELAERFRGQLESAGLRLDDIGFRDDPREVFLSEEGGDVAAVLKAVFGTANDFITGIPEQVQTAVRNSEDDVEQIVSNIELAAGLPDLFRRSDDLGSAFVATLDNLQAQFDEARKRAQDLGLSTEGLEGRFNALNEQLRAERGALLELEAAGLRRQGQSLVALAQRTEGLEEEVAEGIIDQGTLDAIFQRSFDQVISGLSLDQLRTLENVIADVGDEIPNANALLGALGAAIKGFGDTAGDAADDVEDAADQIKTAADVLAASDPARTRAQGVQAITEARGQPLDARALLLAAGIDPNVQSLVGAAPEAASDFQTFLSSFRDVREAPNDSALLSGFAALDDLFASGALSAGQFSAAVNLLTSEFQKSEAQAEETAQAERERQQEQQRAIADAEQSLADALRTRVDLRRQEIDGLRAAADATEQFLGRVDSLQDRLAFGDLAGVGPLERIRRLRSEFDALAGQPLSDLDDRERSRLTEIGGQLVELRDRVFGTTPTGDRDRVQAVLGRLEAQGEAQISDAERQIAELQEANSLDRQALGELGAVRESVDSVAEATHAVEGAVRELAAAGGDVPGGLSGGGAANDNGVGVIRTSDGTFSSLAAAREANELFQAANAAGIPGFADGGSFVVDGRFPGIDAGRDNRLVTIAARDGERVDVTPPELLRAPPVAGLPARGGDDGELRALRAEVRALRAELRGIREGVQEGNAQRRAIGREQIKRTAGVAERIDSSVRDTALVAGEAA